MPCPRGHLQSSSWLRRQYQTSRHQRKWYHSSSHRRQKIASNSHRLRWLLDRGHGMWSDRLTRQRPHRGYVRLPDPFLRPRHLRLLLEAGQSARTQIPQSPRRVAHDRRSTEVSQGRWYGGLDQKFVCAGEESV